MANLEQKITWFLNLILIFEQTCHYNWKSDCELRITIHEIELVNAKSKLKSAEEKSKLFLSNSVEVEINRIGDEASFFNSVYGRWFVLFFSYLYLVLSIWVSLKIK